MSSDSNDESMSPPHQERNNINSNALTHQLLETLLHNENEHLVKIKEAYSKKFELERDIQNFIRESYAKKKELEQDIQKFINEESMLSSTSDLANFSQSLQSDINQLETIKSSLVRKNDLQQDILRRKRELQREIELLQGGGGNISDARSMTYEDDTGPMRKRRREEKEKEESCGAESSNGGGRSGQLLSSSMREAEVDLPDADSQSNGIRVAAADPASVTLVGREQNNDADDTTLQRNEPSVGGGHRDETNFGITRPQKNETSVRGGQQRYEINYTTPPLWYGTRAERKHAKEVADLALTIKEERKRADMFEKGAIRTKTKVSNKDLPILEKIAKNWQKVGHQTNSVRLDVGEALFNKISKADIARFVRFSVYSEESEPWNGIANGDKKYGNIYTTIVRIDNAWKNGDLKQAMESSLSDRHSKTVRPGARGRKSTDPKKLVEKEIARKALEASFRG